MPSILQGQAIYLGCLEEANQGPAALFPYFNGSFIWLIEKVSHKIN